MKSIHGSIVLAALGCGTIQEHMPVQRSSITLPNGIALEYAVQGPDTAVPVILLPGYTDPWQSWMLVMEQLPTDLHVIALSQRGQGRSSKPISGYRPTDYAEDLVAFMDTLQIERAIIVGHSMSAYAAQRFAIDHPQRLVGLMLVGTFSKLKGNTVVTPLYDSTFSKLTDPMDPQFVSDFVKSSFARPAPQQFVDTVTYLDQQVPAHVWRNALSDLLASDHSEELGSINAPTLIVWGDGDPLTSRAEQEVLAATIPNARLLVYEGCGHSPNWDDPARLARDLSAFAQALR